MNRLNRQHKYFENQKYRMSDYHFRKSWFQDESMSFFKLIKARKYSIYQHIRDSAYDNYMIDGLCYANFYGLEGISHLRLKYIRSIKRTRSIKRKRNAIN